MEKTKKKQIRRYISWGLILVTVVTLAVLPLAVGKSGETDTIQASILSTQAGYSDITMSILGGGTLLSSDAVELTIPAQVKLTQYLVANGDLVQKGDAVAKADRVTVMSAITQVQETLDYLREQLEEAEEDTGSDEVIAQAGGTVKQVYAAEGDNVRDVMLEHGALAVLSLDGLMAVQIQRATNLSIGDTVCVTLEDGTETEGTVESNYDGVLTVILADDDYAVGETVRVTSDDGDRIGSGQLYIHSQWNAVAYTGTVGDVLYEAGDYVKPGKVLIKLEETGHSADYLRLADQHREYEKLMMELFQLYQTETITAPANGMISGVDENGNYMLADSGNGWQVSLLANAPNGDDEQQYLNFVTQVVSVGIDGMILRVNPQSVEIVDYKDLSQVDVDPLLMTEEVICRQQVICYELVEGEWVQLEDGTIMPEDILIYAGDGEGNLIWAVRVPKEEEDTQAPDEKDPSTEQQPEETEPSTDSQTPTQPSDQERPSQNTGTGNIQGGGFSGFGGAVQEDVFEVYGLDMVTVAAVTEQDEMTFSISVDELDITKVYLGQTADVTVNALTGAHFDAVVTAIGNSGTGDGGNSKFTVELTLEKTSDMLQGMTASAAIPLETAEHVLTVPVAALTEVNGKTVLYTGYDEKTQTLTGAIEVTLGLSDGENVQILSGINEGDTVCYAYYDELVISNQVETGRSFFK